MRILGLTGSIGMGKSTTAALLAAQGAAVFDADACVHRLYEGEIVPALAEVFPQAVKDGRVDRAILRLAVVGKPREIALLEKIVHPAVQRGKWDFVAAQAKAGTSLCVLDIPLLFETGDHRRVDAVIVATAPPDVQKARILARGGMDEGQVEAILSRQTPDAEKRRRAHFIVETQHGLAHAERRIGVILRALAV
ncbi:dephospho-CoA kinase [Rhodoblastus sphagnicola]|uniref:Dephospho-CoA kinase n=1 Tax=Rhodoblastus sphagnicola TaxID=333368 RepID=A0A2S6NG51_9HYPH|nr:dephospho-CoA kinase [Rhodoblastus sphagnicola]MBB4199456.1 dephospho-CoA kinase [Rhodoblastus sphagnicola]PPQ33570.1 dephospho-CoA kinase [Rhodoblastus sphagnicola]